MDLYSVLRYDLPMNQTSKTPSYEELIKQNKLLNEQMLEMKAKLSWYEERYKLMQQKKFGASSEKNLANQLSFEDLPMFNEAETFREMINIEPKLPEVQDTSQVKSHKRSKPKKSLKNLPVVTTTYEIPLAEQICPTCGNALHVMSKKERVEIEVIPAKVQVHKYITYVYSCRKCENTEHPVVITAPGDRSPVYEKSFVSPSLMADVIAKKYMDALPFYRQEKNYKHYGIDITRNNLCNWSIYVAKQYFSPLEKRMRDILFQEHVIHCDETEVEVLHEPGRDAKRKSRVWVMTNGEYQKDKKIALYRYTPGRSRTDAMEVLHGYSGYIMCDGYTVYDAIAKPKDGQPAMDVKPVACLVHVRRKFADCLKLLKPQERPGTGAQEAVNRLAKIFHEDNLLSNLSIDERKQARIHGDLTLPPDERRKSLHELLCDFFAWVKSEYDESLHETRYGKALKYAIQEEEKVMRVFEDGRLELDNSLAERTVKPFVIGRKNWLFSDTPRGAKASCTLYSIVQTALQNGLIPFEYMKYLLEEMPGKALKDSFLDSLLPWSDTIPDYVKAPTEQ